MRPVRVVKIEALDCILAIILWVSDSCNEGLLSGDRYSYWCLLVVAPSIWMMQSDCLFISRLLKGRHLTATFTLDIWKIKIKFRICTHICKIRNRILNSIDQNCIQNFPECGWWFAFSAWFKRKCICFSIYFWVCSGPSSFHHLPVTVQSTHLSK